jgi:hypothetical protein
MKPNQEENIPVKKRKLTELEQKAVAHVKSKRLPNSGSLYHIINDGDTETLELSIDSTLENGEAIDLYDARMLSTTGASNGTVGMQLFTHLAKALIPGKNLKEISNHMHTVAQLMQALAPQDEYEGQLITQLIILHEHSMEWLGKAMRTERVDFANIYLNGASKLLTRHHETLDTLLKYRRRGEQRVVVEHVNVHSGGQAIVGSVTTGGGMHQNLGEGPHAKV